MGSLRIISGSCSFRLWFLVLSSAASLLVIGYDVKIVYLFEHVYMQCCPQLLPVDAMDAISLIKDTNRDRRRNLGIECYLLGAHETPVHPDQQVSCCSCSRHGKDGIPTYHELRLLERLPQNDDSYAEFAKPV